RSRAEFLRKRTRRCAVERYESDAVEFFPASREYGATPGVGRRLGRWRRRPARQADQIRGPRWTVLTSQEARRPDPVFASICARDRSFRRIRSLSPRIERSTSAANEV